MLNVKTKHATRSRSVTLNILYYVVCVYIIHILYYVKGICLSERFSELTLFLDRSNEDVLHQLGIQWPVIIS